jgi:hypothetical protein
LNNGVEKGISDQVAPMIHQEVSFIYVLKGSNSFLQDELLLN